MCDLLKCNAITSLSPGWPAPALWREWCSAGMSDWHKSGNHLALTHHSCFSGSSVCTGCSFTRIPGFGALVLIYICIMGISWRKNRLVLQFCLQQQRECLISRELLCTICLPQSARYPSATIKRRAHIQFLWGFFWLFNLFCNHYWRIPRGAFFRMS